MRLIREISFFIKNPRKIHEIKNHSIWISMHEEIKEQNLERKIDREDREIDYNS